MRGGEGLVGLLHEALGGRGLIWVGSGGGGGLLK